jgi:hypothetical protein
MIILQFSIWNRQRLTTCSRTSKGLCLNGSSSGSSVLEEDLHPHGLWTGQTLLVNFVSTLDPMTLLEKLSLSSSIST